MPMPVTTCLLVAAGLTAAVGLPVVGIVIALLCAIAEGYARS